MSRRAVRNGLLVSVALLPGVAHAQRSTTLDEISVVATTPVGGAAGVSRGTGGGGGGGGGRVQGVPQPAPQQAAPRAAPQPRAPAPRPAPSDVAAAPAVPPVLPADTRLRGGAQPLYKIPSTVETVTASEIARDTGTGNVLSTLARVTPGLNLSDSQGNNNRVDLNYRGFQASPVQGVPQGLAVYQNGVRINEAFGDIVNFDLIPPSAIQRIDIVTGNPVFGLNALGGAVNIQMKNGFTWQGLEVTALGGSDARTAGNIQYGKVVDNWSLYVNLDGLNDRGWRFESPSKIARSYMDLGYRSQDSEFHLIGALAHTYFGAAAATPVDFTHVDERAIYTYPQSTTTNLGTLQMTGRVDISPTWDLAGNAYFRRFSNSYVDGNDAEFERCGNGCSTPNALRVDDDNFPGVPLDQLRVRGRDGQLIPFRGGVPYGTLDTTKTEATGYGGSLQAANRDRIFGFGNSFVVGGSIDAADYTFKSSSQLGIINPNLRITVDPNNPLYGFVPGVGADLLRTDGAIGIAPSSVIGSNLYMGLYATDTFDVTDQLALTAGGRLNFARVTTRDQTGIAPDVTGTHYFTKINPVAGLTYRFTPNLSLYGGYSESNRAPTPLELSCANPDRPCLLPNSLVADPPLKQVTAQNYEVGFRGSIPSFYDGGLLTYKIGAYRNDLTNDILQIAAPGNAARGYYQNVPATRRQGVEVGAEYTRNDLSVYANYALVDATFQFAGQLSSPNNPLTDQGADPITVRKGNQVPLIPNHQFKVGFDYLVLPGWTVGMNLQAYSSAYYRGDEGNQLPKLPAYYLLGATTRYRVNENLELFALATNITNQRYATFGTFFQPEVVANLYPVNNYRTTTLSQPFSIYGGLRYTFGSAPPPMEEPVIRKY